jgi:hypothetical protein
MKAPGSYDPRAGIRGSVEEKFTEVCMRNPVYWPLFRKSPPPALRGCSVDPSCTTAGGTDAQGKLRKAGSCE